MVDIDLTGRAAVVGGSQPLRAILETPTTPRPGAGGVVLDAGVGRGEVMQRQAKRLAAAGFLTLAVDLYSAGGAKRCLVPTMTAMLRGHGKAFTDIEVARSWLVESRDCTGKIGVFGFCMGGGFAMVSAGDFDAASVIYGQLPRKLDEAVVDACPIVGSFGGKDFSLRGAAAKLETALSNAGIENDVKEYPTAGHAFLNDAEAGPKVLRPLERILGIGPDPVAAQDAWKRIDSFFERHLA